MANSPWLLTRDFNKVAEVSESTSINMYMGIRCMQFREWIFHMGLLDLGYFSSAYTWWHENSMNYVRAARLDKAL